jgi:hypothetical protein
LKKIGSEINKAFLIIISSANNSGYSQNIVMSYEARIRNLEERLNIFYNSNGGRLLLKYYKLRDRLFPVKSVQKRILERIVRFRKKR